MSTRRPLVTIAIPVYEGERHLEEAISSVLAQELPELELIVVDDGSTDSSLAIARRFRDPRIRILENESNQGIPRTQNRALHEARGRYFGILDQDDVALPERLSRQVSFLESHPEVVAVGAAYRTIGAEGPAGGRIKTPPLEGAAIRSALLFYSAMHQPVVLARTDVLRRYGYNESFEVCTDYDLWSRLARDHPLANLPDVLALYREGAHQTSKRRAARLARDTMAVQAESLGRLGLAFSDEDLLRHFQIPRKRRFGIVSDPDGAYLEWLEDWIVRLRAAALASGEYPAAALEPVLRGAWKTVLRRSMKRGHLRATLKHMWSGYPTPR